MSRFTLLLLSILVVGSVAQAKPRKVPLMPRRAALASTTAGRIETVRPGSPGRRHTDLGVELGFSGRKNNTSSDVLGMQALLGGRAFMRLPVATTFYLTPSLGLFMKNEGSGSVSFKRKIVELGVNAQWAFYRTSRSQALLGIAQRVDWLFTSISAPGVTGSVPNTFRYRLGPALGGVIGLSSQLSLVANTEVTYAFTDGGKLGAGLTFGVLFHID